MIMGNKYLILTAVIIKNMISIFDKAFNSIQKIIKNSLNQKTI